MRSMGLADTNSFTQNRLSNRIHHVAQDRKVGPRQRQPEAIAYCLARVSGQATQKNEQGSNVMDAGYCSAREFRMVHSKWGKKGNLQCERHLGVSLKEQTRLYGSDSWSRLLVSETLSGKIIYKFMKYP